MNIDITIKRPSFAGRYYDEYLRTEIRGLLQRKTPIYKVTLDPHDPFRLHASDGRTIKPLDEFESDGGSIPSLAQTIRLPYLSLQRDSFPREYRFHDSGCVAGGYDVLTDEGWTFRPMTRAQIDWYLNDALLAGAANHQERLVIYGFVRAYARAARLV